MSAFYSTNFYNYYFTELSDKRTLTWPFMSDPFLIFLIVILYLLLVRKWGPKYMENKRPYNLTKVIRCYNVFQLVGCIFVIAGIGMSGWFSGEISLGCEPVDYSNNPNPLRLAKFTWWYFMLKLVELLETIFFVLRKKYSQVSNLHLYHHTTTLIISWFAVKYVPGGMSTFSMLLNNFVHVIMYSYYLLSTLGPEWQKKLAKWKNKLTILQMIQFTILILHTSQIFIEDCTFPKIAAYFFFPNVLLVFYFFFNFYKQSYNKKVKSK